MTNYIALAIPVFFLLMGVELWAARRRGARLYRFNDALVDLSCGMSQQVFLVFAAGLLAAGYLWLYRHRFWTLHGPAAWVVAFFAVDFIYYWWHRLSHRVNFLWAVHVVHHQSEDYNLAVALRQAVSIRATSIETTRPRCASGTGCSAPSRRSARRRGCEMCTRLRPFCQPGSRSRSGYGSCARGRPDRVR